MWAGDSTTSSIFIITLSKNMGGMYYRDYLLKTSWLRLTSKPRSSNSKGSSSCRNIWRSCYSIRKLDLVANWGTSCLISSLPFRWKRVNFWNKVALWETSSHSPHLSSTTAKSYWTSTWVTVNQSTSSAKTTKKNSNSKHSKTKFSSSSKPPKKSTR